MTDFPFWAKVLEPPEIMFNNLITQTLVINNNILERNYPNDYLSCDHISNHFTEYARITCQFGDYTTPLDTWQLLKDNHKDLPIFEQRELVYNSTRECNTFNVTFALWIINSLVGSGAKILDPSSGWGDRLIAAIASKASVYNGFDPNKDLQKGYKNIIKVLGLTSKIKAKVTPIPFEDSKLRTIYDLAMTSPPYFDLEIYGHDANQSIIKYSSYEDWLEFYKLYLTKMTKAVKKNGYIVIYIEDITSKGKRYNMKTFTKDTMNTLDVKYYTQFGLKVGKTVRYAMVYKKI